MDLDQLQDLVPLLDPTALPRILTREDARRLGYSPDAIHHRLNTGRWRRVLPRTYLTVDTLTQVDRLHAALAFAGPDAQLSAAAALFDLGLRTVGPPTSVLVLVPPSNRCRSTAWVRVRRTRRLGPPVQWPGPRRVPPARGVADLGLELDRLDDVRALVAEAVRRNLCSVDDIAAALAEGPRNGSANLRQATKDVTAGAWSAPEARAATVLKRAGIPPFEQNAKLQLSTGRWVVVDFLWRALRAVLEIDSDTHHALTGDAEHTADRHQLLETDGFSVVHRTPRYVHTSSAAFADGVDRWLRARAEQLGVPYLCSR